MGVHQYIGARYVPKFFDNAGSTDWISGISYEPLTIVTYLNDSFTSKKPVPASVGAPNLNPDYWALTGAFNAQLSQVSSDVTQLTADLNGQIIVIDSAFDEVDPNNSKMARKIISGASFQALGITSQNSVILGVNAYNSMSSSWWSNDLYPGQYNHIKKIGATIASDTYAAGQTKDKILSNVANTWDIVGCRVTWNQVNVLNVVPIVKSPGTLYINITNTYTSSITDEGYVEVYYIDRTAEVFAQAMLPTIGAKLRVDGNGDTYLQVLSNLRTQYDVGDQFRIAILKYDNVISL